MQRGGQIATRGIISLLLISGIYCLTSRLVSGCHPLRGITRESLQLEGKKRPGAAVRYIYHLGKLLWHAEGSKVTVTPTAVAGALTEFARDTSSAHANCTRRQICRDWERLWLRGREPQYPIYVLYLDLHHEQCINYHTDLFLRGYYKEG